MQINDETIQAANLAGFRLMRARRFAEFDARQFRVTYRSLLLLFRVIRFEQYSFPAGILPHVCAV